MIDRIISGIMSNWIIVTISFALLVGGTIAAYQKYGIKRVLLGKKNDNRQLVYRRGDGSVVWGETLKTWQIILTGGMSILTLFLIFMLLALSFIYQHDIQATRENDEKLCQEFGTVFPTKEQVEAYNDRNKQINLTEVLNERGTTDLGSP